MNEQSEKIEITFFQNRWHELGNTCSNSTITNEILTNPIVPHVAGHGLKKLFKRIPDKCLCCRIKLMHGINIDGANKHSMSYDTSHIDLRDKGGLIWPSKLIVMLPGSIIKIFERFIQLENLMNDHCASCSSSRVALLALKMSSTTLCQNRHFQCF